ncbi:MAG: hypothetical protein M1832_001723, partial [Thelocarpon impressellum]
SRPRGRRSLARDRAAADAVAEADEKADGVAGREYSTLAPGPGTATASAASTTRGRWVAFMVWLKTRLYKLTRKVGGGR